MYALNYQEVKINLEKGGGGEKVKVLGELKLNMDSQTTSPHSNLSTLPFPTDPSERT